MKRLFIPLLAFFTLPNVVNSSHLYNQKELIVTSESSRESIELAKYLKDNGVVKYSAYWCPNCLNQSELFGCVLRRIDKEQIPGMPNSGLILVQI